MDHGEERSWLLCCEYLFVNKSCCREKTVRQKADEIWGQLFGGSAVTKEFLFKLSDYSSATWSQSKSLICIQLCHVPKTK